MKLESSQLRIGNYVNVPREDQSPFRIDFFEFLHEDDCKVARRMFLGKAEVHPLTWYFKDLSPIALTEEWLIKFGFKRFPWGLVIGDLLFKDNLDNPCEELTIEIGNGFRRTVRFVHQLQNLFYALTGEELKLKNI